MPVYDDVGTVVRKVPDAERRVVAALRQIADSIELGHCVQQCDVSAGIVSYVDIDGTLVKSRSDGTREMHLRWCDVEQACEHTEWKQCFTGTILSRD